MDEVSFADEGAGLISTRSHGSIIEEHVRRLAGYLGVPDFVYRPTHELRGSGSREVSDGLLIVGDEGVILQVKSRDPDAAKRETPQRAERWCRKESDDALGQGIGTRRRLAAGGVSVRSLRGYDRSLLSSPGWPIVVVLAHPQPPPITFETRQRSLVLSVDDWLNLHMIIRSTVGIITYVRRAIDAGIDAPLGEESQRYARLAAADLEWASFSPTADPYLPSSPLTDEEAMFADAFDILIENVADPGSQGWDPEEYLRIVEQLDRVPTLIRVKLGKLILERLRDSQRSHERRSFTTVDRESGRRMVFLFDHDEDETDPDGRHFAAQLLAYATLRHQHGIEAGAPAESSTLAVGIVGYPDGSRRHAYVLVGEGFAPLPPDLRVSMEARFGIFDGATVREP